MSRCESIGVQFLDSIQEIEELYVLIARNAGDRRFTGGIAGGERVDHLGLETRFVIEDVVRNIKLFGDAAGIVNVLAGAAAARPGRGLAVIVKLQRNADHLVSLLLQHTSDDRGIDAARHRNDDPVGFAA